MVSVVVSVVSAAGSTAETKELREPPSVWRGFFYAKIPKDKELTLCEVRLSFRTNKHEGGETMQRFKVKGVNDDKDTCECCGKAGLKRVVWIEDTETLEVRHFGTTCATNPAKAFGLKREIGKAVREFDSKQKQKARAALDERIKALCRIACDTFTGEMKQGRFGLIPVDSAAFQAHKNKVITDGLCN